MFIYSFLRWEERQKIVSASLWPLSQHLSLCFIYPFIYSLD